VTLIDKAQSLLRITQAHRIARRYFIVNGFDGALTMLGLIVGFMLGGPVELSIVANACLGAAIALGVSGFSSAYVSENAERQRALEKLEKTMLTDLRHSSHGEAARWVPILIALTNGSAPLLVCMLILSPLWLVRAGFGLPLAPLRAAVLVALLIVFLLGAYLGRIAGISWLKSGAQTLLIAVVTVALIYLLEGD